MSKTLYEYKSRQISKEDFNLVIFMTKKEYMRPLENVHNFINSLGSTDIFNKEREVNNLGHT